MMTRPLTVQETAERLHVSPRRVRALIASGRLRAEKAGWSWMIDPRVVLAYKPRRSGGQNKPRPCPKCGVMLQSKAIRRKHRCARSTVS